LTWGVNEVFAETGTYRHALCNRLDFLERP